MVFRCRNLDGDKLDDVLSVKSLSNMPRWCILEVSALTEMTGEYGKYGVASYATTLPDKSRQTGRVRFTETALSSCWMTPPCLCLYQGVKTGKNGRQFHDVSAIKVTQGAENLKKVADSFRSLSTKAILAAFTVQSLDAFAPNSALVFKDVTKRMLRRDVEEQLTVSYETIVDGEAIEGVVIVPSRYESELRKRGCGVMVYRGKKTAQNGRVYHDLCVVDEELVNYL